MEPQIAVIVPVYRQPGYLKEAVISAVNQSMQGVRVIIVNDGCPYSSTDLVGRFLRDAYPETVTYLHKPNGGLSSARNHGIWFALTSWPSVEAVFPLDADNRLSPDTLLKLWRDLSEAPSDVGWIYQDFEIFGSETATWRVGVPFNLYRLIHENYCDAGSLIRREVFDAGIRYDERMKSGYEDWELYVNAGLSGFRGQHLGETGFLYRRHGHSMLAAARRKHADIHEFILNKHRSRLRTSDLVRREHQDAPRFAVVETDKDIAYFATDLSSNQRDEMPVDKFTELVNRSLQEDWPRETYFPPMILFAESQVLELLNSMKVLPGIAYGLQQAISRVDYAVVSLDFADDPHRIELLPDHRSGEIILFAMRVRKWLELRDGFGKKAVGMLSKLQLRSEQITLRVGESHLEATASNSLFGRLFCRRRREADLNNGRDAALQPANPCELGLRKIRGLGLQDEVVEVLRGIKKADLESDRLNKVRGSWRTPPHVAFSDWHQVETASGVFPCCIEPLGTRLTNVVWAVPWLTLGGVDRCVLFLANALARVCPEMRLHIVVTGSNTIEADPGLLRTFSTVTFLPEEENERRRVLESVLLGADVVVNAHSLAAYEFLPELKARSHAIWMSYLHVIDIDAHGRPAGYPLLATRQYGDLIDHFLVISRQLRAWCSNMGIPDEKIHLLANAPTIRPATISDAIEIAAQKGDQTYSPENPLQILFSGRFDYQKGIDRLPRIAKGLEERGVPFHLTLLGKNVVKTRDSESLVVASTILPATVESEELSRRYKDADVLLLPSRWEGMPLSMLEAMAFGAVVVATDVGAVSETIQDRKTGFLLDPNLPESEIIAATCDVLAAISASSQELKTLRIDAARAAMDLSWERAATVVAELIRATELTSTGSAA